MRRSTVVGQQRLWLRFMRPRKMLAACVLLLERGGTISCTVSGSRLFSTDLPQEGLEVPCTMKFQGPPKHVAKMQKLIVPATKKPSSTDHDSKTTIGVEQHNKKRKIASGDIVDVLTCSALVKPWFQ